MAQEGGAADAEDDPSSGGGGGGGCAVSTTVITVNSPSSPEEDGSAAGNVGVVGAAAAGSDGDGNRLFVKHHQKVSRSSSSRPEPPGGGDADDDDDDGPPRVFPSGLLRRTRSAPASRRGGRSRREQKRQQNQLRGIIRRLSSSTKRRRGRSGTNASSSGTAGGTAGAGAGAGVTLVSTLSSTMGGHGDKAKGKKLGHRRVQTGGEVTYKKIETTQLMGSIQLGIQQSVGSLANQPDRDLLIKDFKPIESVSFTKDGHLEKTPAHNYSEFRFRTYAPFAFKKYRQMFEIDESEFLVSICSVPMVELSNPGASGSIFYITQDDMFICKTVMHKEADFLQKLLPGYYMNLKQNPRTLLPKFFGLYCYSCNAKNVRIIVMNNLLPSGLRMHHRFDLKGSTYKRKASKGERSKTSPTFKDLDFLEVYPEGIFLQPELYDNLMNSIQRDCRVLESFKIMDYSLLIGIHNLDLAAREAPFSGGDSDHNAEGDSADGAAAAAAVPVPHVPKKPPLLSQNSVVALPNTSLLERTGSVSYREGRAIAHSTALESITMVGEAAVEQQQQQQQQHRADSGSMGSSAGSSSKRSFQEEEYDEEDAVDSSVKNVWGGIPARNHRGENLLLFIGVIDILQEYGVLKKAEHYWKSLIHDGDTVSVHRPSFYARRFQSFMREKVFKKMPSPLRPGASFRRNQFRRTISKGEADSSAVTAAAVAVVGTTTTSVDVLQHQVEVSGGGDAGSPPPPRGIRDQAVTVITIGDGPSSPSSAGATTGANPGATAQPSSSEGIVNLPTVLQDRRARLSSTSSEPQQQQQQQQEQQQHQVLQARTSGPRSPQSPPAAAAAAQSSSRPDVADVVSSPSSPEPRPASSTGGDDRHETGSIITMTSDERVQIYVPSPQTTPYNTIHPGQVRKASTSTTTTASSAFGQIARVGILAGTDSSRSVTPIKTATAAAAAATSTATTTTTDGEEGTATQETSLEMVRISIRTSSSEVSNASSSATATAQLRTLGDDVPSLPSDRAEAPGGEADGAAPISLSDITLTEDEDREKEEP